MQNIGFGRTYRCLRWMRKYHQLQLPAETVIAQMSGKNRTMDWNRETELFPVPYFHVVFTLTRSIEQNTALHEPKMLYDILFESAWETLQTFGKTKIPNGNDCCFVHLGTEFEFIRICTALFWVVAWMKTELENIKMTVNFFFGKCIE